MKKRLFLVCALLILAGAVLLAARRSRPFPELRGDYLGQRPPRELAERFAPGIVSSQHIDSVPVFSSDGTEIYWSRIVGRGRGEIVSSRVEDGRWSRPQALTWSRGELDARPTLTGDGQRMLFVSRRSLAGRPPAPRCFRLWTATRDGTAWSPPAAVAGPLDSGFEDFSAVAADGTLYLSSWRPGGPSVSAAVVYASRWIDGHWQEPQRLPETVNSGRGNLVAGVAPDQRWLIVARIGADDTTDLFVSFRRPDGSWSEARDLGPAVNSAGYEHFASLTADGRYLFFASDRDGNLDVYWLSADFLDRLAADEG